MPDLNELRQALLKVQKPARYTGGEPGCVYKDKKEVHLRFAFCFPDTYEVGMSFLGMKILYEILNDAESFGARAFMPWVDMKEEMESADIPLYALESKDALSNLTWWDLRFSTSSPTPIFLPCFIWRHSASMRPARGRHAHYGRGRPVCMQRRAAGRFLRFFYARRGGGPAPRCV